MIWDLGLFDVRTQKKGLFVAKKIANVRITTKVNDTQQRRLVDPI